MYSIALFIVVSAVFQTVEEPQLQDRISPERDARGIPVVSAEPNVPPGVNQVIPVGVPVIIAPNQHLFFRTEPATTVYPPCSRGSTDRCAQTYERRRSRGPASVSCEAPNYIDRNGACVPPD